MMVVDVLNLRCSVLFSLLSFGSIVVFIFIVVRALGGSWARKKRHAFPDFLKGLN